MFDRSPEKWRSTWMKNGSPIGTYSWENRSAAIQYMKGIASSTSLSSQARFLSWSIRRREDWVGQGMGADYPHLEESDLGSWELVHCCWQVWVNLIDVYSLILKLLTWRANGKQCAREHGSYLKLPYTYKLNLIFRLKQGGAFWTRVQSYIQYLDLKVSLVDA